MKSRLGSVCLFAIVLTCGHASGQADPAQLPVAKTFIEGTPIQGANGMAFDPDGNLWVASVLGRRLVQVDPFSGRTLGVRGLEVGVETPDDTTFGPDGTQYFTSFFTGKVGAIAPDGQHWQVAQLPPGANPIAFTRDFTRLFVGVCFLGDALYEVDPTGVDAPQLIAEGLGAGCAANGMAFGADGLLYAPQTGTGHLIRIDVNTGTHEILQEGYSPLFNGVAFHPKTDTLYGVDYQSVVRIDLETGTHTVIAQLEHLLDNLVFDEDGRLFVSHLATGEVVQVFGDGHTRKLRPDLLSVPQGLAIDDEGQRLFVGNGGLILELDARNGRVLGELSWAGFLTMGLHYSDGTLIGASASDWLVAGLSAETGAFQFVRPDFAAPTDAVLLPDGDLVVAEAASGRVVRSPQQGVGVYDVLASGLGQPAGLVLAGDDLYVSDFVAGAVYRIVDDGQVLAAPEPVVQGLQGPEGLAWTPDGTLLVVESGAGRVTEVDVDSASTHSLPFDLQLGGPPLAVFPPSQYFHGIAVSAEGSVYAADNLANEVQWLR